jgi:hypothetical protein
MKPALSDSDSSRTDSASTSTSTSTVRSSQNGMSQDSEHPPPHTKVVNVWNLRKEQMAARSMAAAATTTTPSETARHPTSHPPPLTNHPLVPVSPSKSAASPSANGLQHDLTHRPHPEGPPRTTGRYAHASTSDERGGSWPAGFGKDGIGDGEGRLRADSLKAGADVKGGECYGSLFFRLRFAYGRPHTRFFFWHEVII